MKIMTVSICAILLFSALFPAGARCEPIGVEGLVDRFYEATEVQRGEIRDSSIGENIIAAGVIDNVEDSSFFNTADNVRENYFTVKTHVRNTASGNPYETVFFYRDRNAVKGLNKGERIEKHGKLLKIVDRGLWLYLWIEVE